ncbi:MAG: hypothetical protein AB2A00_43585 [Myxococcota bacterium]
MASPVGSPNAFTRILQGPVGTLVGRMLQVVGVARPEGVDLAAQLRRDEMDRQVRYVQLLDQLYGRLLPEGSVVPRPQDVLRARAEGGAPVPRGYAPSLGGSEGEVGRSVQRAQADDPLFKLQLEIALGGNITGGDGDTGFTVWRPEQPDRIPQLARSAPALAATAPQGDGSTPAPVAGVPMAPGASEVPAAPGAPASRFNVPLITESRAPGLVEPPPAMGSILTGLQRMEANIMNLVKVRVAKDGSVPPVPMQQLGSVVGQTAVAMGPQASTGLGKLPITKGMQAQMAAAPDVPGTAAIQGMSDTMKMEMLMSMMKQLRRMYDLLSNMLASIHQMRSEAIRNIA